VRDTFVTMASTVAAASRVSRVLAIDWLRGVVMVLMALDHVRFFFTDLHFAPENIDRTTLALFMTRWVTHFCAPLFFFLAGTSAYLTGLRRGEPPSRHLLMRGLWLVALELTVIGFAWNFRPGYSFAGVIWALGWSMVILAAVARLDVRVITVLSIVVLSAHDLLNTVSASAFGPFEPLWRILHVPGEVHIGPVTWFILYPLIPWFAVMTLGYAAGPIWTWSIERRGRFLITVGGATTALFLVLRLTNAYGNPRGTSSGRVPFAVYQESSKTLISLVNVCKYPPSLQFLLMTLGLSMIVLAIADAWLERRGARALSGVFITFGRVPFFYYVCHLYLIHLLALLVAHIDGQPSQWLGWYGDQSALPPPEYGYDLPVIYGVWIVVTAALYLPCRAFERLKREHRAAWLRFA
jgi:uncharacterized membrane protein